MSKFKSGHRTTRYLLSTKDICYFWLTLYIMHNKLASDSSFIFFINASKLFNYYREIIIIKYVNENVNDE